jgi:RNA polymerase-binding transcription factor
MDLERARKLVAQERARIEQALGQLGQQGPLESDDRVEPDELDSEDLYQDTFDQGRRSDLDEALAAVERAETRLADGTYGLSVESGKPIPDARLEALPTAERTVEEEERLGRRPPPAPYG